MPTCFLSSFPFFQFPLGTFVHPSGVEQSVEHCIEAMTRLYGDKQGKQYRVWLDQVSAAQVGSDTWLVKFYKWELSGEVIIGSLKVFPLPYPYFFIYLFTCYLARPDYVSTCHCSFISVIGLNILAKLSKP